MAAGVTCNRWQPPLTLNPSAEAPCCLREPICVGWKRRVHPFSRHGEVQVSRDADTSTVGRRCEREALERVRCRKRARCGEEAHRLIRKTDRSPLAPNLKSKCQQKVEVVDVFVALTPSWIL